MNQTADLQAQPLQGSVGTSSRVIVYLLLLGLAFASAGQAVLLKIKPNTPAGASISMQLLAGLMLVAGCLLFGLSTFRHRFDHVRLELPAQSTDTSRIIRPRLVSDLWLLIAGSLALAAIYLFSTFGETPLTVYLWLVSILALFASQFRLRGLSFLRIDASERFYLVGLVLLLVITLVTRVYHLTTLPYNLDGDFASVGLEARALATDQQQHIFALGWADIPFLGYSPAWLSMKLFGTGLAGLNASGVVEGLLVIVGVYLLGRDLFQARVGFLAAALLTVSYTHLAASRQSVYIDPVVFMLFAIYFLLIGLRETRGWAVIASGVLTAFCLQLYYSGRLVLPIIAFVLIFLSIFHRTWLRPRLGLILLWGLAILVTLGPMLLVFYRGPDALIARSREVFILNPEVVQHEDGVYHIHTILALSLEQAHRTVLLFHYFPDKGTQFALGLPFLDPFTATLFTLGLGYTICHWRRLAGWLLLSWVTLGLVIGCFLTVNPPFWPRLMILLPPVALLAAIAFNFLYEFIHRGFIGLSGSLAPAASLVVLLLLLGVGWRNWNLYVNAKGSYATPRTFIARYLAELPPATQAHLVSAYFKYQDREFEFLAPGHLVDNLPSEQVVVTGVPQNSTRMLILGAEQQAVVERLQNLYPGTAVEAHSGNTPDDVSFYVVHLP